MPPTRRFTTKQSVTFKRKITRRKLRKSTWLDLLAHHNTGSPLHSFQHIQPCRPSSDPPSTIHPPETLQPVQTSHDECDHSNPFSETFPAVHCDVSRQTEQCQKPAIDHSEEDVLQPQHAIADLVYDEDIDVQNQEADSATSSSSDCASPSDFLDVEGHFEDRLFALTSGNIIALTLLCGSVKFSVKQYEIVRTIVKYAGKDTELPSYSTAQRKLFPHLLNNCFPKSFIKNFIPKSDCDQHTGPEQSDENDRQREPAVCSRIVYPSEWAKVDVSSPLYFENIYHDATLNRADQSLFKLETSPIVRHRAPFINASRYLYADDIYGRRPVAPGEILSFKVLNLPFGTSERELTENRFNLSRASQGIHISSTVLASWCVGSPSNMTESAKAALRQVQGSRRVVIIRMSTGILIDGEDSIAVESSERRAHQRFFTSTDQMEGSVRPGDICTLLSTSHGDSDNVPEILCIIVSRCWKKYEGMPSQFVLWIRTRFDRDIAQTFKPFDIQRVLEVPRCVVNDKQVMSFGLNKQDPYCIGTLKDGRRYVIYRVLLYCDDFTQSGSVYSQASCGGVYLLPLGLSTSARRSRTAVHVVSLTPAGVSTNEILLEIVPDIVKGSTGVEGKLPSGEPVMIFIDVVGFVADYPAAAEPLDVIGHTGNAPCTHCTIRKYKSGGSSSMGFTTSIHAFNSPSFRCAERQEALRESNISNREANILGMKPNEYTEKHAFPLSALRTQLLHVQNRIPLTSENVPVLTGLFDPYRSSVVAPDHLLSGLARNVMDLCFRVVRPNIRKDLDIAICSALMENDLLRQKTVYNDRKLQLHSMSLSSVFCVLLVFHTVCMGLQFHLHSSDIERRSLKLLKYLKDLVAMTYWNPSVDTDGEETCEMIRVHDGRSYHALLREMAMRYVQGVDSFCKSYPDVGSILDKPNLHRLLELYYHTIPAFGHVSLIQELVFETAHQPLKRSVSRGNHRNAEVSAVVHSMGNDWQGRLAMLLEKLLSDDMEKENETLLGLQNLLLGTDSIVIAGNSDVSEGDRGSQKINGKFHRLIQRCLSTPLVQLLRNNGNVNSGLMGRKAQWLTLTDGRKPQFDESRRDTWNVDSMMETARAMLCVHIRNFTEQKNEIRIVWQAKRAMSHNHTNKKEILESGSLVQVLVKRSQENNRLIRPSGGYDHKLCIFAVVGFLVGSDEGLWAASVRCEMNEKDIVLVPCNPEPKSIQVILLNNGVRRVGVYHKCSSSDTCTVDRERREIKHNETVLSGGIFRIQTRSQGYPPRIA